MEERGTLTSWEIKEGFTEEVVFELDFKDEVFIWQLWGVICSFQAKRPSEDKGTEACMCVLEKGKQFSVARV